MPRKLKGGAIVDASVTSTQIDPAIVNQIADAYNQANTALSTGGSGSAQANQAYASANLAYAQANAARSDANTTFATVNTTFGTINTNYQAAYAQANSAYGQANAAYNAANNAAVRVSANSGTSISANTISFNNTSTITVTVTGSGANANIEFTAVGGAAYDQANAAYNKANDAYAASNNSNLLLGGAITGSLNVSQDLIVGGNIYLEGNTTYINVTTYSIEDSLVYYASNNKLSDSVDIGFMGGKNTGGTYSHTGFARDASDGKWKLFDGLPEEGHVGNIVNFANTYLATLVANVEANSITLVGNTVATQANLTLSHDQANTARDTANGAYASANGSYAQANGAYAQANGAYAQANGAYGQANGAYSSANSAANTVRVSQNGASTLSAKQLNFVNTANIKIVVTDSADGNANIALDATISRTNTNIFTQSFVAANGNANLPYVLNYTPWGVDYVFVYKNGISLTPTVEYTLAGNTVTVVPAGETNDDIDIRYIVDASFVPQSNTTIIIDANTVAAQTNTFYLSQNVASVNRLAVSKNGLRLTPNSHYTLTNNNVVTLAAVAEVSDELVFEYFFDLGNVVDWTLAYNQANAAYTAANNRVLKAGDTMTGNLLISGATLNTATANISTIVTGNNLTLSTGAASNGNIIFSANNAEDMRILANGFIGIGTASPKANLSLGDSIANNKLYVYDAANDVYGFGIAPSSFLIYSGRLGAANGGILFGNSNGTAFIETVRFTNSGRVGIGTTNPLQKLEIDGGSSSTYLKVVGQNRGAFIGQDSLGMAVYQQNNALMYFATNDTERMRLTAAGSLLLGTTSDYHGQKLAVANTIFLPHAASSDIGGLVKGYYDPSSNAYAGGLTFQTFDFNGSGYVMRDVLDINGRGMVRTALQPFFYADTVASVSAAGSVVVRYTNIRQSRGTYGYNTSTGRFTAPISGVYHFDWVYLYQSASAGLTIDDGYNLNGTFAFGGNRFKYENYTFGDGYVAVQGHATVYLNTSDYFEVKTSNQNVPGVIFYSQSSWGYLQGYLVG